MSFANRHNPVSDFPKYPVKYCGWSDVIPDSCYKVSWVGSYNGKFGPQPYVDLAPVENAAEYLRVRLPKFMLDDIDNIAHTAEDMEEIKAGKVGVKIKPYTTKGGNQTARVEWVDL